MGWGTPDILGFTPLCHLGSCLVGKRCPGEDEREMGEVRNHLGLLLMPTEGASQECSRLLPPWPWP